MHARDAICSWKYFAFCILNVIESQLIVAVRISYYGSFQTVVWGSSEKFKISVSLFIVIWLLRIVVMLVEFLCCVPFAILFFALLVLHILSNFYYVLVARYHVWNRICNLSFVRMVLCIVMILLVGLCLSRSFCFAMQVSFAPSYILHCFAFLFVHFVCRHTRAAGSSLGDHIFVQCFCFSFFFKNIVRTLWPFCFLQWYFRV